jgi:hypothetical protein
MKEVDDLVKKAAEAQQSEHALRFSQAALNVAHAYQVKETVEKTKTGTK